MKKLLVAVFCLLLSSTSVADDRPYLLKILDKSTGSTVNLAVTGKHNCEVLSSVLNQYSERYEHFCTLLKEGMEAPSYILNLVREDKVIQVAGYWEKDTCQMHAEILKLSDARAFCTGRGLGA
jgi:hypothetical protein